MSAELVLVPLAIAAGALAQAISGMGFSLVAAPVLLVALGPRDGVALCVLLAAFSSVAPLVQNRRHLQSAPVARLLLPTLLCTPMFAWLLGAADTRWLGVAGGVSVVVGVVLLAVGLRSAWFARPQAAVAVGASSALLNVIGGVGGPPVGLYAANSSWSGATLRANLHAFFLVQNCVTALVLGLRAPDAVQVSALVGGTLVGMAVAGRMSSETVRRVVLGVSLLGGLGLLGGALSA